MSAYVIADVTVTDADQMAKYREWSTKAAAEFGATFMVRGGAITVLEGDWKPSRVVILQFPDSETVKKWYAGETYTHARKLRENAGVMRMVMVEGV
ncbi:DUF1330 domain-containing protein [Variovorax sp. PCZ-1]|uniref:DUF1330 domain-containing protein n=1 Tax=Variovorax sp. PCZ-1 TaxID=2835533 RepID=UPI001BCD9D54|nr:DUF1330 domain-containing protein [Variovorax sp. PCZ-1]MBS7807409.1 DUF1330 domain-containing protein [Variovorax sp. PCZ-1]